MVCLIYEPEHWSDTEDDILHDGESQAELNTKTCWAFGTRPGISTILGAPHSYVAVLRIARRDSVAPSTVNIHTEVEEGSCILVT